MSYISSKEIGEKWHISRRRVQILCEEGRIPRAFKVGNTWAIPEDAEKPQDKRKFNSPIGRKMKINVESERM